MNQIKFSVILPTYNRPNTVTKAIESVLNQIHSNWQLYIIVDDIENDYTLIKKQYLNDSRITFIQNSKNVGKNKSLNFALDWLQKDNFSGYVIFLDDDDWLTKNCLVDFAEAIKKNPGYYWFVSQRVHSTTKEPFTINKTGKEIINYQHDVLVRRAFSGDTTHCINFDLAKDLRFPTLIKNAEEWLYFTELSNKQKNFVYLPVAGTYSEGYASDGLTHKYHSQKEKSQNNKAIIKELWQKKLFTPYTILYVLGRLLKSLK